jgi:hypothetical protein
MHVRQPARDLHHLRPIEALLLDPLDRGDIDVLAALRRAEPAATLRRERRRAERRRKRCDQEESRHGSGQPSRQSGRGS